MWQKRKEIYFLIKLLTFQRFLNLLFLYLSYFISIILKKPKIFAQPFSVSIEPTTTCNLNCAECPTGNNSLTRPLGKISKEIFEKIINNVHIKTFYLNLFLQGEPFLHPQLIEMITYSISKNMFVCISTNGHFFDYEICLKLIKSGVQKIIISFDGTTQKTYSKYRIGGNLTKVIDGIKTLSKTKKELKSNTPEIVIQTLINSYNENEIQTLKQLATKTGANRIELKSMQIYNNTKFLSNNNNYNRYKKDTEGNLLLKKSIRNRCKRLWTNAVFTWDGILTPCCYDKNGDYSIGNIQNSSFKNLWNSNELNSFRYNVLNNRKNIYICQNCTE